MEKEAVLGTCRAGLLGAQPHIQNDDCMDWRPDPPGDHDHIPVQTSTPIETARRVIAAQASVNRVLKKERDHWRQRAEEAEEVAGDLRTRLDNALDDLQYGEND